jgi:hypothetical protein
MHTTIPLSPWTKEQLAKLKEELGTTWDGVVRVLINVYKKSAAPDPTGLSKQMLATVGSIYIMKNNKSDYMKLLAYLLKRDFATYDEVRQLLGDKTDKIIDTLKKYCLIEVRETENGKIVELLCYPQEIKTPEHVILRISFRLEFCRLYCPHLDTCYLYKRALVNNAMVGRDFVFSPEDYEKASIRELIGKCISVCVEE